MNEWMTEWVSDKKVSVINLCYSLKQNQASKPEITDNDNRKIDEDEDETENGWGEEGEEA